MRQERQVVLFFYYKNIGGENNMFEKTAVESVFLTKIKEDLRELFRNAKDPLAVLLQTMQSDEFRRNVPEELSAPVEEKLRGLTFADETEFLEKVLAVALPIFELGKKAKGELPKQIGREMFTAEDIARTVELIAEHEAKKIFVVGNVGSGKTTFAREIANDLGYKNIDVDKFFQIFRQEQGREVADLAELMQFILQRESPPFVINHADLLRQGLLGEADVVIYLNPKKEEQLKTRELRAANAAEGEWREMTEDYYDFVIQENTKNFDELNGEVLYQNEKSGTAVKLI